jgi:hypothetical protein
MAKAHMFSDGFETLLNSIPKNTSLEQWQADYRQVIFSMGLRILELFPNEAVAGGGGQSGGPHNLSELACFVLDVRSPKRRKR